MKASEARQLTSEYRNSVEVEPLWANLVERIKAAASEGKSTLVDPFIGIGGDRLGMLSRSQQTALKLRLAAEGYLYEDHPDPDPGHPCSRAYSTISW